ncbi:hypothetical protein [Arenicella xantha]|uniref:Uncharacterized protein n=1 Tax=Arenicella xantha TaxID=644221 RepID=A0A395JJU2_9GAMM|nr:hypothetical protein [Arenicella xantha]RBP48944.1 hypothetical protein DFR28_105284 [Arenicella xantha]
MSTKINVPNVFRKVVLVTMTAYCVLLVLPYLWTSFYSKQVLSVLAWWGYGGLISIYGVVPYVFVAAMLVSLTGLYFFKRWARTMFALTMLAIGIVSPLFGLAIAPSFDTLFAHVFGLGCGAILALSYLSEAANEFTKQR